MNDDITLTQECYNILAQAIVLADSTDPDNIILDGRLWRKAFDEIMNINMENDDDTQR